MRAQLAVSSLIVFGLLLIGLGFIQLPYVTTTSDTVIIQTYSERTGQSEELVTIVFTEYQTTVSEALTILTTTIIETVQNQITVTRTISQVINKTLNITTPLSLGPFNVNASSTIEVLWLSDKDVEIYIASRETLESPNDWTLLGRGVSGRVVLKTSTATSIYILLKTFLNNAVLKQLTVLSSGEETIYEERQRTVAAETKTTITTVTPLTKTRTATTYSIVTKTEYYTVAMQTVLTETRYADLWFMTFTGSFLVFVGLLLLVLLLKTLAKPIK